MDGERKKKPEKRVGVHLETRDHQKTVNGRGKKRETEIIKIETRTTGTRRERETERGRERERDGDRDDRFRRPRFDTLVKTVVLRLKFL